MPYHAYYSRKQRDLYLINNSSYINRNITITHNYITTGGKVLETTHVFDTDKYPIEKQCSLIYDDKIYLGIVDKWYSSGEIV